MIKLIPYEKLEIKSSLAPHQIKQKLTEIIEPNKIFRNHFSRQHKSFQGKIEGDDFKMIRIIHYQNSFLPVIRGKILGSTIQISMRMHRFIEIFLVFWILGCSLIAWTLAYSKNPSLIEEVSPFVMLIYGYLLCVISFNSEAKKTKKFLYEFLKHGQACE